MWCQLMKYFKLLMIYSQHPPFKASIIIQAVFTDFNDLFSAPTIQTKHYTCAVCTDSG